MLPGEKDEHTGRRGDDDLRAERGHRGAERGAEPVVARRPVRRFAARPGRGVHRLVRCLFRYRVRLSLLCHVSPSLQE